MSDSSARGERLFGTDGIRGTPGEYPLTDGMIYKIGSSIAKVILCKQKTQENFKVVIGKDTRLSGQRIESLLSEAITRHGVDVLLAGIITTPGLSFLVKESKAHMGIMISASHNQPKDNGIKFFNTEGCKLMQHEEQCIEEIIFGDFRHGDTEFKSAGTGKVLQLEQASERYLKFLKSSAEGISLKGMRIALDCCWGSTSIFAKRLFEELGADICPIHDLPQGENINMGGTMNPHLLRDLVIEDKTDVGFAFDGDGDRATVIDNQGTILDGDYIMAMIAFNRHKNKKLFHNTIVVTVMSNCGLTSALHEKGIKTVVTSVGDKHVLEALQHNNLTIGGEQSGHIIFLDYLPTPDGMLTALQVLKVMQDEKRPLTELSKCMKKFPQILVNVKVSEKKPFKEMPVVQKKLEEYQKQLSDEGRILLRYSGTEKLARVMVEGKSKEQIEFIAQSLADLIRQEIGVAEEEVTK